MVNSNLNALLFCNVLAKNNNEPPPRPAKPFSTADLSNRVSHRHQNDEPPPRPPGKYDDEFFSYHQQNEAFSRPQYGPPVDNRPPAVTPDFAPHVLPRNNVEGKLKNQEIFLSFWKN